MSKYTLTLCSEFVVLVLAIVWYASTFAIEALITAIGTATAFAASLFFREKGQRKQSGIQVKNSQDNIIIQNNRGDIRINRSEQHGTH